MTIFFNGLPSKKTKVFPWFSAFQILDYSFFFWQRISKLITSVYGRNRTYFYWNAMEDTGFRLFGF